MVAGMSGSPSGCAVGLFWVFWKNVFRWGFSLTLLLSKKGEFSKNNISLLDESGALPM
jgi:hypothetical protein